METDLNYGRLDKDGGEESPRVEETGAGYESEIWEGVCSFIFPLQVEIKERKQDSR